jgi:hypothetical protein
MRCVRPVAPPGGRARLALGQPKSKKEKTMGLDMFAYTTLENPAGSVDFKIGDATEIHYWRKHPNLHGWMEKLYRDKGGSEESFNCVNVRLNRQDLDRLEADIKAKRLPHTIGFFFGESDSDIDDDLEFVGKAREAMAANLTVFYSSWW